MIPEVWIADLVHETLERHIRPPHGRYAETTILQCGERFTTNLLAPLDIAADEVLGAALP